MCVFVQQAGATNGPRCPCVGNKERTEGRETRRRPPLTPVDQTPPPDTPHDTRTQREQRAIERTEEYDLSPDFARTWHPYAKSMTGSIEPSAFHSPPGTLGGGQKARLLPPPPAAVPLPLVFAPFEVFEMFVCPPEPFVPVRQSPWLQDSSTEP